MLPKITNIGHFPVRISIRRCVYLEELGAALVEEELRFIIMQYYHVQIAIKMHKYLMY